jgi:hypothetical protein
VVLELERSLILARVDSGVSYWLDEINAQFICLASHGLLFQQLSSLQD